MEISFERNAFALRIIPGQRYRLGQLLSENWNDLTSKFEEMKMSNFSMWEADNIVFGYFESKECAENWDEEDRGFFNAVCRKFDGCFSWISRPWENMQLMYEDYGIVRNSKELIRHRVFITRLKPGAEQTYKLRHDRLAMAREGVNRGPDSNFSIWSAGGYIFGYDEIDTTMEHEKTEAEKQAESEWETTMLEIMTWVTDDMDWLTGEHHPHIRRLCYH